MTPLHPAVLRLIETVIKAGKKANIPVSMCGEMAGEKEHTQLLLGLGLREFSLHTASLLEIKKIINNTNIDELGSLIKKVHNTSSGAEVNLLLQRLNTE